MSAQQLALDLGHRPALGRDDFLVAPCNEAAVALIDAWPAWPGPAAALYGAPGCGKSHLAAVWRARTGATAVDARALAHGDIPRLMPPAGRCAVEIAEGGLGGDRRCEEALLHIYNLAAEAGGSVLLIARAAPARWPIHLADLRSRLVAAPAAAIGPPDDLLIGAVLVKLFADRQLRVGQDVIDYLLARMARSFETARRLVAAIDESAMAERKNITVPLVRTVLKDIEA